MKTADFMTGNVRIPDDRESWDALSDEERWAAYNDVLAVARNCKLVEVAHHHTMTVFQTALAEATFQRLKTRAEERCKAEIDGWFKGFDKTGDR